MALPLMVGCSNCVSNLSSCHALLSSSSTCSGWMQDKVAVPLRKTPCPGVATIVPMAIDNVQTESTPLQKRGELSRRALTLGALIGANMSIVAEHAEAVSTSRRALRYEQIPESEYKTLPSGLKYYDLKVGGGPVAVKGSRVAIHYVAKWKGITFMTSRQGMGVTGGTPYGFDVGASEFGMVLKGLDQGVQGMRVGGQRLLIVPPELAYGNRGIQEIPPGATLNINVELLSIKQDIFGSRVKIVEG